MVNPSPPPMMTQLMIVPPLWSPCVSSMAMREPAGVVFHARALGLGLSVAFSVVSGGIIPFNDLSRAVLSPSRQDATLIPSIVPPEWKASAQTGWRADSHAASSARMAARCDGDPLV